MTGYEYIRTIADKLENVSKEDARFEAMQILGNAIGIQDIRPLLSFEITLDENQQTRVQDLVKERQKNWPLQYLLGEWEFMGFPMIVRPGVLIPRQDTEMLCMKALDLMNENGYKTVLDLCCGTGCIGISLAILHSAVVTFADISEEALLVAEENIVRSGIEAETVETDLFDELQGRKFDMICCNPPYLSDADMLSMQAELKFEPELALYGGPDGLDFYRRISKEYKNHLNSAGKLLMEIGYTQWEAVQELFPDAELVKDYAGNARVVITD